MFCIFTSECQKRSRKRTAALLDRYARRIGRRTWVAELTVEALDDIYRHLRRTASKTTSVACFKNKGYETMSMQWVVGNKNAYDHIYGAFSCGSRKRQRAIPLWVKIGMLLCVCAGRVHDIGKDTSHFQDKLRSTIMRIADYIRHEWLSAHVLNVALAERAEMLSEGFAPPRDSFVQQLQTRRNFTSTAIGELPLDSVSSAHDALKFIVTTHHRVFGPVVGSGAVDASNHVCPASMDSCPNISTRPKDLVALEKKNLLAAARCIERLEATKKDMGEHDASNFWRGTAIIARAALLLADHHVSSRPSKAGGQYRGPIANSREKQPLDWHLEEVGLQAARYLRYFEGKDLPGLPPGLVDKILAPAPAGSRFGWQDSLARAVSEVKGPSIVFNLAATGAGKTRANLKCVCAANNDGRPVRVVAAFNLRTLTLQTFDEYKQQFGMTQEDAALLIGDSTTRILHRATQNSAPDNDDSPKEFLPEVTGAESLASPEWLQELERNSNLPLGALIGAPCLVSTMDFIDDAGNLHRTKRHSLALLRVATSDIIIDEVDSFDVNSYPAILRLVELAGLFGRNVVLSSATLSEKLASAAYRAWMRGYSMSAQVFGTPHPTIILGSNFKDPVTMQCSKISGLDFSATYNAFMAHVPPRRKKIAKILPITKATNGGQPADYYSQVANYIDEFHEGNCSTIFEKSVSFGLIRVATVKTAMGLASFLAKNGATRNGADMVICPYHARDLFGRRFYKEYYLDKILKCAPSGERFGIGYLEERITSSFSNNVTFIVVATPLEEVGRDHDFDWAIIEPSSMHSILQIAGRVNRHRLFDKKSPNIGILQFNFKGWLNKAYPFSNPGLQCEISGSRGRTESSHKSADIFEMLKPISSSMLGDTFEITTELCFGADRTTFAANDDRAIAETILRAEAIRDHPLGWASSAWLIKYPLRNKMLSETFYYDPDQQSIFQFSDNDISEKETDVREEGPVSDGKNFLRNTWLCPTINEVLEFIKGMGVADMAYQKSLAFSLYPENKKPEDEPKGIRISWLGAIR